MLPVTTYTVSDVALAVSRAIGRAFPDEIWVQGEIRDLKRAPSGHVYFNLVDPDSEESPAPILPVTLFASEKFAVNRMLQRSGAVRMTDGVAVRIRGQVGHYAARGTVQLRMTWIDTDYTLGKLAAERERLIRSLEKRGLLNRNQLLPLPLVPLRVGLITSAGSAADADFTHELEASGYAWDLVRYDARVQGADAIGDVVRGLRVLADEAVDAIALVRGGGAQTDLAAFDSEDVAVAIANCPVPVVTGIGHEIDVSVADLVARSHKTPTACAAALVARVAEYVARLDHIAAAMRRVANGRIRTAAGAVDHATARLRRSALAAGGRADRHLRSMQRDILHAGSSELRRQSERLTSVARRIQRGGAVQIDSAAAAIDRMFARIGSVAVRALDDARSDIEALEHRSDVLDPQRLLARGWSITRTAGGDLVTAPDDVFTGTVLRTTVAGGDIRSVVTEEKRDG